MTITWDSKAYESGIDRGVLYFKSTSGIPWSGLTSVEEVVSKEEASVYLDGFRYVHLQNTENLGLSVEAFTYPPEFDSYLDSEQVFGLSYRTFHTDGYKIHLIYSATVIPTDNSLVTESSVVEPTAFVWELATKPIKIPGHRGSPHLIIDTSIASEEVVDVIETALYGYEDNPPYMPTLDELLAMFDVTSVLRIIDHGDGTWTAIGPDDVVQMLDEFTFQIDYPSAIFIDEYTYEISSM